ncbi:ORF6N domain-containing protein [Mucilaginibacter ginkgonis]|uniref:ORF6N domain-containing protein n=1 Tax=Mucilaginibacter ginkgonis TaxID=2682091 RepID=A0A6I4HWY0_9SPHI|nr:ORF6N domain-containing protein [Mucilaginibacter ginkgonis]QQL51215.1 ORF6N domain-containing protein [Mucilaginibacter ginkgonis]
MSDLIINENLLASKIYYIRKQKVMLDRDLATLYGVETKVLKQSVKRHAKRFPVDFMFEMSSDEFKNWRSQFVTSNSDLMGLRYAPYCFTEQGVAMLSSILNSETAIEINIQIIRLFTKLRQLLNDETDLKIDVEQIKRKLEYHDKNIELVFKYLDELIEKRNVNQPRKTIGYKSDEL